MGEARTIQISQLLKVVLLGGDAVGKSWLLHRYVVGPPQDVTPCIPPTIGVDFKTKIVYQDHDRVVRFTIWNTVGNARFDDFSTMYCRGAHAAIIVYDITQESSFVKAMFWVDKLQRVSSPNIFKALAGNKADRVSEREVTYEVAQSYAHDNDVDLFMEVSSLTGENVENLFLTVGYNVEMANTSMAELRKAIRKDSKALNLGGRRLLRVSDTVTELTEVEVLNLSHNELTKLPTSTSKLLSLTTLNLNHNKLTQFPEVVVNLINLTHLFVNDNQLSSLPPSMKNLEKLQELELRNNKMKRLCKDIVDLNHLEKLSVRGNPLAFEEIRSLMKLQRISIDISAPAEILVQGDVAKQLYEKALRDGSVNVYRGRILLIGQDRAGKTSLKKSLLGLPFDPKEQSTEGIEVDPSVCEIEVEQVKNWNSTGENKPSLAEFSEDISRMLAEKQYHWILNEAKEDSGMESEVELSGDESTMAMDKKSSNANQVCALNVWSDSSLKVKGMVIVN